MKNIVRLTLFFSLNFVILFLLAIMLGLLSSWIEFARFIPLDTRSGENIIDLAWEALLVALYLSILLALSYTARRNISIPAAIISILVLSCAFFMGISLGISRTGALEVNFRPVSAVHGGPGLILSRADNAAVLLRHSSDIQGPRVVSIPAQPLIYQEVPLGPNNSILSLPPLPFEDNTPWFVRNLGIDFYLGAAELRGRLGHSFLYFAIYAFSLILLLVSMRFVLDLSRWPLANLFLGALAFRGIVALEAFLNTREINSMIDSFLNERVAPMLITPSVFGALALLVIIYTLLIRIARPRRVEDD